MNTISTIQHKNTALFFGKQEEREKISPKEISFQDDQIKIQGNFHHVQQGDIERISHWTAQDAQKALERLEGENLHSVHGELDPARVKMLISRVAA